MVHNAQSGFDEIDFRFSFVVQCDERLSDLKQRTSERACAQSMAFVTASGAPGMRIGARVQPKCARRGHISMCADATPAPSHPSAKFCQLCAAPMELKTPEGDERVRSVCTACQTVAYENPKVVVAAVPVSLDKKRVLLAKRAIPPVSTWTFPAGFLELSEETVTGAKRESWEEARAELEIASGSLLAVYNVIAANQVQLVYLADVLNEDTVAPGPESLAVQMFTWEEIPWSELSFPTVEWALRHAHEHLTSKVSLTPQLRTKLADGSYVTT